LVGVARVVVPLGALHVHPRGGAVIAVVRVGVAPGDDGRVVDAPGRRRGAGERDHEVLVERQRTLFAGQRVLVGATAGRRGGEVVDVVRQWVGDGEPAAVAGTAVVHGQRPGDGVAGLDVVRADRLEQRQVRALPWGGVGRGVVGPVVVGLIADH